MNRVDVIISGGGMIGSIAAVAAVQSGFSVLLLESQKQSLMAKDVRRDLRVSAISWDNIKYLKKLKIFENLIQSRIHSYAQMQVWDNRGKGEIKFQTDYSRQPCLGYMMENINLIHASWKTLSGNPQCQILEQSEIKTIENLSNQVRIKLSNGDEFKSKLLIAAEGRNSFARRYAKIKTQENAYHQKGLVAYIQIENAPDDTALQAFNNGGPIGILPFSDGLFSIVWSVTEEECDKWLKCSDEKFELRLKSEIGKDFGAIKLVSQRAAFPLSQLYAEHYFKNRIVLCGDSAHGIHPLAGQGVNLGIGDIQLLIKLLSNSNLRDQELLRQSLKKYQRRRISKVRETSEMMSLLHHLFKDDTHIKKPLRNLGLNILDKLSIKKWLMNQAGS